MTHELGSWQLWQGRQSHWRKPLFVPRQVHEGRITIYQDEHDQEADGVLIDREAAQWAGVMTADCLPLVLVTPVAALALHVSRKTLVHGLLEAVPRVFSVAAITHVWIGPHICAEHFVFDWVGDDVAAFRERWPEAVREVNGKLQLSLREVVQHYLLAWSVSAEAVHEDGRCTFETQKLPSYRRALTLHEKVQEQWLTAVRRVTAGSV